MKFIDLHCDLLSYWADVEGRTPFDNVVRCSLSQLKQGNVALQVLAVFTFTEKGSVAFAEKQIALFSELISQEKYQSSQVRSAQDLQKAIEANQTGVALAIENASGLCEEDEKLDRAFERFEEYGKKAGHIFYLGLTHHLENRFGGGNQSEVGLKSDGEVLLEYISGKKIAVDLAHTSRKLASDILNFVYKRNLVIPILDSHSNFNAVFPNLRNQTDETATEIARRGGVIGLNFLKDYTGDSYKALFAHIEHAHKLGIEKHIALGADYFFVEDAKDSPRYPYYFPELFDAACYPFLAKALHEHGFENEQIFALAFDNVRNFIVKNF